MMQQLQQVMLNGFKDGLLVHNDLKKRIKNILLLSSICYLNPFPCDIIEMKSEKRKTLFVEALTADTRVIRVIQISEHICL